MSWSDSVLYISLQTLIKKFRCWFRLFISFPSFYILPTILVSWYSTFFSHPMYVSQPSKLFFLFYLFILFLPWSSTLYFATVICPNHLSCSFCFTFYIVYCMAFHFLSCPLFVPQILFVLFLLHSPYICVPAMEVLPILPLYIISSIVFYSSSGHYFHLKYASILPFYSHSMYVSQQSKLIFHYIFLFILFLSWSSTLLSQYFCLTYSSCSFFLSHPMYMYKPSKLLFQFYVFISFLPCLPHFI